MDINRNEVVYLWSCNSYKRAEDAFEELRNSDGDEIETVNHLIETVAKLNQISAWLQGAADSLTECWDAQTSAYDHAQEQINADE